MDDMLAVRPYQVHMKVPLDPVIVPAPKADRLRELYDRAVSEVVDAIRGRLSEGQKPKRPGRPQVSLRENGMPSISDAPFGGGNGPIEHSSVLEPPWGDDEARAQGKFPIDRFPAMHALKSFVSTEPEVGAAYMVNPHERILEILVEGGVEWAANTHFQRFGATESTLGTRTISLMPVLNAIILPRLRTPVVVPIALTRFGFDRARLSEDALIVRMSEGLQRARWDQKARAANGHDAVLASATHALILTDWSIPNEAKWDLGQTLSSPAPQVTAVVESFFAALRIELGIETGYAQEIRLGRGWRSHGRIGEPEVYAVGARRYPTWFDDYGWNAEELALVRRADIERVASTWRDMQGLEDGRFALALRRLNAAMTRDDPADAILDATIALEILLGDGDGQSIAWKLRMRAAALTGVDADRETMGKVRDAIRDTYEARSAIVHGGRKRSASSADGGYAASRQAIGVLRQVLQSLIRHQEYLSPQRIDDELLLESRLSAPPKMSADGIPEGAGDDRSD